MTLKTSSYELRYRPLQWWTLFNLGEFLRYKDFFFLLVQRNISIRYRQTLIGVGWVLLQPLVNLVIFTLIFNRMAGIPSSGGLPYPVFLMFGLLFWQYFSTAVSFASNALIDNTEMVNRVYVPRYMLPFSVVLSIGVDFIVGLGLLLVMVLVWGVSFSWLSVMLWPVLFACLLVFVFGISLFLASINAQFRDIRFIVPFFMQVLFYLTPVFYPIDILSNHPVLKQVLIYGNPLTGLITTARALYSGGQVDLSLLGVSAGVSFVILVVGWCFFRSRENVLADII